MATVEVTTVLQPKGSLARNPDGTLAGVPRELAHQVQYQLMHVLTLLHSISQEVPEGGDADHADADGMTSPSSRTVTLSAIADEKVRSIVKILSPYV